MRELGIYGGAQGIWVDKARTGELTPGGSGVTVSVLHTGQSYADDLARYYAEELSWLANKTPEQLKEIHQVKLVFPGARVIQEGPRVMTGRKCTVHTVSF